MSLEDFRERQAEAWFDAAGLLLGRADDDDRVLGFHWTKVHAEGTAVGEVYVVGGRPARRRARHRQGADHRRPAPPARARARRR